MEIVGDPDGDTVRPGRAGAARNVPAANSETRITKMKKQTARFIVYSYPDFLPNFLLAVFSKRVNCPLSSAREGIALIDTPDEQEESRLL
jgi:hypothetical protein